MKIIVVVLVIGIGLTGIVALAYLYAVWRFSHAMDGARLTEGDKTKMVAFLKLAEQMGHRLQKNPDQPHVQVDYTTVGFPRNEQQLRDIRTAMTFFEVEFGVRPARVSDLRQLGAKEHYSNAQMSIIEHWAEDCQMIG